MALALYLKTNWVHYICLDPLLPYSTGTALFSAGIKSQKGQGYGLVDGMLSPQCLVPLMTCRIEGAVTLNLSRLKRLPVGGVEIMRGDASSGYIVLIT
ncbi:hypothetical protein TNCV_618021 [Trichonephila clavipes]|nr:hypothetical protein TNCV_618021 [Trichonephila clavipes]